MAAPATAEDARPNAGGLNHPDDPQNLLGHIRQRSTQRDSLFPVSPLGWLHDSATQAKQDLYKATDLELGFRFVQLFQGLSESLPGEDRRGTSAQANLVGTWELLNKGKPTQGQFYFDLEGRWDYGTTGPTPLGAAGLGSSIQTANGYAQYSPTFIFRNAYWHQGSPQAGWSYRLGKITPDQTLSTSAHISPFTTFLPLASTGPFAIALPDSGYGAVGAWYINDRATLVGLVSDANADRFDRGDIGEGAFSQRFRAAGIARQRFDSERFEAFCAEHLADLAQRELFVIVDHFGNQRIRSDNCRCRQPRQRAPNKRL